MQPRIEIPQDVVRPHIEALGDFVGTGCVGFVGLHVPGINDDHYHEEGTVMVNASNALEQNKDGGDFVHMGNIPDDALSVASMTNDKFSRMQNMPTNIRFKPYVVIAPPGWKSYVPLTEERKQAHKNGWSGVKFIDCPPEGVGEFIPDQDGFWTRPN